MRVDLRNKYNCDHEIILAINTSIKLLVVCAVFESFLQIINLKHLFIT
jgi:hypothetical protein